MLVGSTTLFQTSFFFGSLISFKGNTVETQCQQEKDAVWPIYCWKLSEKYQKPIRFMLKILSLTEAVSINQVNCG